MAPTNLDAHYPALSSLAQAQPRPLTLRQIGQMCAGEGPSGPHRGLPGLADCCRDVLAGIPRHGDCDAYGYLATLDACVRQLPIDHPARQSTWSKISGDGRSFLDAVAAAAWVVQLWAVDLAARPDEPFPQPSTAAADLVVSLDDGPYWLDALGIDYAPNAFYGLPADGRAAVPDPTRAELLDELGELVIKRYDRKFREAVTGGSLAGQSVGVLVCLAHADDGVVRQLIAAQPPAELFSPDMPGLDLVWVHSLRASRHSDILEPVTLLEWMRPKVR